MEIEIVKLVQTLANGFNDVLFFIFTKFGEEIFFFAAFFILWWCLGKSSSIKLLITYFVSVFANTALKSIVSRPRPHVASSEIVNKLPASGSSFPSGHSQSYANISGFLLFYNFKNVFTKTAKILIPICVLLFGIFGVGLSRLYFGQHYLTDVLVGLTIGFLISYLMVLFFKWFNKKVVFNKKTNIILSCAVVVSVLICNLVVMFTNFLSEKYALKIVVFSGLIFAIVLSFWLDENFIKYSPKEKTKFQLLKIIVGLSTTFGLYCMLNLFLKNILVLELIKYFVVSCFALILLPFLFKIYKHKGSKMKIKTNEKVITNSEKETRKFAKAFAKTIGSNEVILLSGDLGAGKTTFTKHLLKALKVKDSVTSPTFTIMKEYYGKKHKFFHFDMYRIESLEELEEIGFADYVNGMKENSVVLIEWWENVKEAIPNGCTHITINKLGENSREFIVSKN